MNRIRHNSPSAIQCLRAFHILFSAYLLFRCYYYNHYKTQKYYFCYRYFCYHYYHITLLLNTLLQILSYPGVVELTTQLLILENIIWLPLCRINKFGLNTLPSKIVAIPYTCGLSLDSRTGGHGKAAQPEGLAWGQGSSGGDTFLDNKASHQSCLWRHSGTLNESTNVGVKTGGSRVGGTELCV